MLCGQSIPGSGKGSQRTGSTGVSDQSGGARMHDGKGSGDCTAGHDRAGCLSCRKTGRAPGGNDAEGHHAADDGIRYDILLKEIIIIKHLFFSSFPLP